MNDPENEPKQATMIMPAIYLIATLIVVSVSCYYTYKFAYQMGWEEKQIFEIEQHPYFINMKEGMQVYADRNNWTGIFGRIWWGDGAGYAQAEKILGIEREDNWIPFLKNDSGFYPCPFCGHEDITLETIGLIRKGELAKCSNCGANAHRGVWNARN